jgi:hypothetical protein
MLDLHEPVWEKIRAGNLAADGRGD